jgi:hypothetical protein
MNNAFADVSLVFGRIKAHQTIPYAKNLRA